MDQPVLVAYATKYGATAEIAERVGQVLADAGMETNVADVKDVSGAEDYGAVVLGIAVYIGKWRKEGVGFLKANLDALAARPVWLFSSGPTGEGDPVELLDGWRYPDSMQPVIDRIKPRDVAVFHGALDPSMMNFIEKRMIKMVKTEAGDFRDWEAITAWAEGVATELRGGTPSTSGGAW